MNPVNPEKANVFIVEDNADNLFVVQILLEDAGVKWHNARASGRQLFRWLEDNAQMRLNAGFYLHVILLDINIPYEDGFKVLRKIRAHDLLQQTRVIAVTANVLPTDVERARQAGFDGFIGKPVDRHRFPDQIRRILAGEAVWEPI